MRILLAEDNPMNLQLATRLLEKHGHSVIVARNGWEAIVALERDDIDLVLMDVQMPEVDGLEATTTIRRKEQRTGGHVPIIAMTASALAGDREQCLAAGMDAYVSKPIRAAELIAVIGDLAAVLRKGQVEADHYRLCMVLDWDEALAHVGNDPALLREVSATFLDQAPRWIGAIRNALDRQDAGQLKATVHPLKGALGILAAAEAFAAAQRLETLGRERTLCGAREAFEQLELALERLTLTLADFAHGGRTEQRPEAAVNGTEQH
jgi:CheY-like chemotaxis protein